MAAICNMLLCNFSIYASVIVERKQNIELKEVKAAIKQIEKGISCSQELRQHGKLYQKGVERK